MPTRSDDAELESLLRRVVREALGAEVASIEPIRGHLGLRRFARVRLAGSGPASLVARVDLPEDPTARPSGAAPEPPLEPLRALLESAGLPVPARLGADEAAGVELLEDLGSVSLMAAASAADAAERQALYAEACALLPRLQSVTDPGDVAAFRRRLDTDLFRYKAGLFETWSLATIPGGATPERRELVRNVFTRVAREAGSAPARLAHRDFQSSNLIVRAGREPGRRVAMIDFQGAFLAPPEYDLVCLLRDSYLELPDAEIARHLEATRPQLPDAPDPETSTHRFDLLTLTRKGKDHARFVSAARVRGERGYLRFVPTTVRHLRRAATRAAAREPELAPFAELLAELPETPCAA
jgi:aminoglycoside/choline kinase family phosphotransferase